MPRRRLPAIREGAINRKPTLAYEARKAAIIDEGLLQALTLAEEEALVDPWHRRNRTEIDGIVYDRNELGVMLAFAIDGGDVIFSRSPACSIPGRPGRSLGGPIRQPDPLSCKCQPWWHSLRGSPPPAGRRR